MKDLGGKVQSLGSPGDVEQQLSFLPAPDILHNEGSRNREQPHQSPLLLLLVHCHFNLSRRPAGKEEKREMERSVVTVSLRNNHYHHHHHYYYYLLLLLLLRLR